MKFIKKYKLILNIFLGIIITLIFMISININNNKKNIKEATKKIKYNINEGNYVNARRICNLTFSKIPKYEYNILFKDIAKMSKEIKDIPYGERCNEKMFLEMEKYKFLSKEHRFKIYENLGNLYLIDSNYAKASEYILDTLIMSKDMEYNIIEEKQLINLGVLFSQIQGYDTGVETIKESLKINIKNTKQAEIIRLYAYVNISEIYLRMGKYKECERYLSMINKDRKHVDIKDYSDIDVLANTIQANLYLNEGKYELAKEYIELAEKFLKFNDEKIFKYTKELLYLTKGQYYSSIGNYYKSIDIYNKILSFSDYKNNNSLNEEYVLEKLVKLYDKTKQYELEDIYIDKLISAIKNNENIRYRDYSNYVLEQAKEKYIVRKDRESIRFLMLIILCGTIIIGYMYKINKKRLKKMKYITLHDNLTGVYNRGYFDEKYKELINNKFKFSILMIDIDNFKYLNDTFGHQFGDEVLKTITSVILNLLNERCVLCRYGGEEFVILHKYSFKEESVLTAELIRSAVEHLSWSKDIKVTISIGIAYRLNDGLDTLSKADMNLYKAKNNGKNKIVV
ncbi:diguanylate kinase signaling protein [[Clostridium] sordellii]|uniref:tetratricopeptide repeat-containing diguanylate cyclase n=1 Tax=Paraclostridium sordellii TaxID=1505 RepID=UPI0005E1740C|nr:GGDEF domain-containing protein [Paeniclostridium sordellii]CEO15100.1 diguanylate kinase signaling protein [[Clostridium] sordellii] [Paeniclostridium sordellii]